ncbi:MAG: Beta-galactosidase C-terminal domain, partial [Clostridiales bacterium]|nr:Beta-galactosidase C-terminal domain [Clostridiales bacterium]
VAEAEWNGRKVHVDCFMESLLPEKDTEVLARYTTSYLKGEPVLTEHRVGKGRVLHFGGVFTRQAARRFLKNLDLAEPYEELIKAPDTVEVVGRVRDGQKWLFVLNYLPEAQEIKLNEKMVSLLDEETAEGRVEIPPYGVAVYRI